MKFLALVLLLVTFSSYAALGDSRYGVQAQLNMSKPNVDGGTGSVDEEYSLSGGAGVRALWGLNDSGLSLRSGLALRQKQAKFDLGSTDVTLEYLYLSIPLTLHYMVESQSDTKFGFFGGLGADLLVDDDCDVDGNNNCDYDDGKTFVMPLIVGFDFMFNNNWGMEAWYEHALTEVDDDVKLNSFVGGYYQFE